ncbi:MAG TPA: glycosyltransferase [Polyangia bacterium]|nr:glycosyltransferase [Polyangia bacterium]
MRTTRCDLHIHSAASVGNDEWYTRLFGCPESYAEPARQYELCKARGMSLVTLTDHDTIDGGLTLIDRPDFFLSEEVTTVFPENGCVMHVLAWNITRDQHDEIQARRNNVYELCEYLNRAAIAHGLAHPLLSPNWGLDAATFEKVLLLFPTMEGINGLTDRRIEPDLATMLDRLTPEVIAALVGKHCMDAHGDTPHRKALTAGSDDHGHRRSGTIYTEVDGSLDPAAFLRACMAGSGRPVGQQAHLATMATCVKQTTYRHISQQQSLGEHCGNPFLELMDVLAGREPPAPADGRAAGFLSTLMAGHRDAAVDVGTPVDILQIPDAATDEDDIRIVEAAAGVTDKVLEQGLDRLIDAAQTFNFHGLMSGAHDLFGGLMTAVPMLFAADHFGRQERQVRKLREQWRAYPLPEPEGRMALFSDSLDHVDGVSTWCKRFVTRARAAGRTVLVPHCRGDGSPDELPAVTSFALPLYECMRMHVPSLTRGVDWAWRQRVTHVELATPGPMGLVGLWIAKLLRLPVTASYHTELLGLVPTLGGHALLARAIRKYLAWFYRQVDRVFAMSSRSRETIVDLGVKPEKVSVMPVAVDPDDFSPKHRTSAVYELLNLSVGNRPVVLSVGRLSEEKNLPVVVEAVERLQARNPAPILLVVGDGPERQRLEERCQDKPFVSFLGVQHGDTLKRLYASARVFAFASRVDTLGLVNMEAMSSGIPVLVPADACIAEFVTHGLSAECYEFGAAGLAAAIGRVLDDPSRAQRLAVGGRKAMIDRWEGASFSRIWQSMTQQN